MRKLFVCSFALALACQRQPASQKGTIPEHREWPPSQRTPNPIPDENRLAGDPDWLRNFTQSWNHQIEGYTDRVSAKAGEAVQVMVRSDTARGATWTLYRLGWYGGAGARKLADGTVQVASQPACPDDKSTGMVRCAWAPTFTLTVPHEAVSGLYVIRVKRDDGYATYLPVVIKDDRQADLYFQASVTTWQAYNAWGGESLYADADDDIPGGFAVQVTFDRPYLAWNGTGQMLRWEQYMARYLERHGYDVSYTTSLDVSREGVDAVKKRGAFLSVAHDEYWPGPERDAIDTARDVGVPLYFFGANPAYWKVRLSEPGADGNARVITCYKMHPELDPLAGTPDRTGRFRDAAINRPEEALVGVMYESWMFFGHPWVVTGASHPLYAGTGLKEGDTLPMLVGYEYDRTFSNDTPVKATLVAHSPVIDAEGKPGFAESTVYTAPSGALVFGAGTIYWALGLDGPQRDGRIERMTANLLQLGLNIRVPQALQAVTAPAPIAPDPAWATDVRTAGGGMPGPAAVAPLPDGTWVMADSRAHRIWRVDAAGSVTPFAGDGNPTGDPRYDNVPALQARFFQPTFVLADAAGNVYVADTHNAAIRKIANDANRTVSTVAGTLFARGNVDGVGSAARFNNPMGLAWMDATHILIADAYNHAIRVLDVSTRNVTTLAVTHGGDEHDGPAASASFFYPTAVAHAPDGRVFFIASFSATLKVIGTDAAHTVTTLVNGGPGFADGPGTTARLLPQGGLVWDGSGLLVADSANQRIRRVAPGTDAASTRVQTWAGSGRAGSADGAASAASFEMPLGIYRASDGTLYVADGGAGALRVVRK